MWPTRTGPSVGAWREFFEMGRTIVALRDAAEGANERVGALAANVERIAELNEKLWSHHLEFCGQVTVEVANAERTVLEELEALRRSVVDLRDHQQSKSGRPPL